MKKIKLIIKWISLIVLSIVVALIAYIYINKDEIVEGMKEELNKSSQIAADFKDPSIHFISSFPNLGIKVNNLHVYNKNEVVHKDIVKADHVHFIFDIASIINKSEKNKIKKIHIEHPVLNLHQYKNNSNFSLIDTTTSTVTSESDPFIFDLDKITINEGHIIYKDHSSGFGTEISQFDYTGKGEVNDNLLYFDSKIDAEINEINTGSMSMLNNTKFKFNGNLSTDIENMVFGLKNAILQLNNVNIATNGDLTLHENEMEINAEMKSNNEDFKDFLSLVPSLYAGHLDKINTSGNADLNIDINGKYGINSFPKVNINSTIRNAAIAYAGQSSSIDNINLDMNVDVNNLSDYTVDIPAFRFQNNKQEFNGKLNYKDTKSQAFIDLLAKGIVDIDLIKQSFPIEALEGISGIIDTDLKLKGNLDDISNQLYDKIDFEGYLKTNDIRINQKDIAPIKFSNLDVKMNPRSLEIPSFNVHINEDLVQGKMSIDNPLAILTNKNTINIKGDIKAKQLNMDEIFKESSSSSSSSSLVENSQQTSDTLFTEQMPYDFNIKADIGQLTYDKKEYKNVVISATGDESKLNIKKASLSHKKSNIDIAGQIRNYNQYANDKGKLKGKLNINSNYLNVNDFMEAEPTNSKKESQQASSPPMIPENLDIAVYGNIKKLLFDDIVLDKLKGDITVANQELKFDKVNCNALGGEMDFNGLYSSVNEDKPSFAINYDNKNLSFEKTFAHIDMMKTFMPIMSYLDGYLSTNVKIAGNLDNQFNIDPTSIIADGYFETLNAALNEFPITKKISDLLGIDKLKNMKLVDSKNWLSIKNGNVEIKEFDQSIEGIDMKISGSHNIDKSVNYLVKAHVPRELLAKSKISNTVNTGLDFLSSEASKYGVDINAGSHIDFNINISGTLLKPILKIKPTGSSGESVKDVVKGKIEDEINKQKEYVLDSINKAKDRILQETKDSIARAKNRLEAEARKKIEEEKQKLLKKAEAEAKKRLEEKIAKQVKDSLENVLKNKAEDLIPDDTKDDIKKKLEDLNPFKKKKK